MFENKQKKKKGVITEDEAAALFRRYPPQTLFTLLKEVWQFADDVKFDWKAIVEKSSTGIRSAKEYQFLWRHLAYRERLWTSLDGNEPTDDDSDLEFELQPIPAPSAEVTSEAAGCVKALMQSSYPCEFHSTNKSEACHGLQTSNGHSVQSRPSDEEIDVLNETVDERPTSKKRRHIKLEEGTSKQKKNIKWTEIEDLDLERAVMKSGEKNWKDIAKEFKHDRNATQLNQRWLHLKKKKRFAESKPGHSGNSDVDIKAAHNAINMFIDGPAKRFSAKKSAATFNTASQPCPQASNSQQEGSSQTTRVMKNVTTYIKPQYATLIRPSISTTSPQASNLLQVASHLPRETTNKPRTTPKSPPASTQPDATAVIKAVAIAAGARVAEPSVAAYATSLLANSKTAVHFKTGSDFGSIFKIGTVLPSKSGRPKN